MSFHVVRLTKLEAADRQLNQAITLFFDRGDMLAVHTLTGASFQLFADLGKVSGVVSRFRSHDLIKPEGRKQWNRALNSTQNFLKHADKDAGEEHAYVEEGTILLLYEAVELAQRVSPQSSGRRFIFQLWFVFSHPQMVDPSLLARLTAVNTFAIDQTDRSRWAELIHKF